MNKNVVDKDFMIEHGRYLINRPLKIIDQYLKLWPKLLTLNLTDEAFEWGKIQIISFISLIKEEGHIDFRFGTYKRDNDMFEYYIKYNKEIWDRDAQLSGIKSDILSLIYKEFKYILSTTILDSIDIIFVYDVIKIKI